MGSATARVLIPHLHFPSSSSHNPSTNPNTKSSKPFSCPNHNPLPTRRLLLFSLPIATAFLLPIPSNPIQPSSCHAVKSFDPGSRSEREASAAISRRVSEAVELLDKGRELQALGDFNQALLYFTQVIDEYKDFAFSDYARVGRALALYEIGDREEAIAEMEDVSISLKGYPGTSIVFAQILDSRPTDRRGYDVDAVKQRFWLEKETLSYKVHAALAAALYVDKHAALLAENQFTIATLLDPHYVDISYVKETKHWPPSLISSLQHFLTLS